VSNASKRVWPMVEQRVVSIPRDSHTTGDTISRGTGEGERRRGREKGVKRRGGDLPEPCRRERRRSADE